MVAVVVNVIPTNQKELTADSPAKFILTCPRGAEATVRNPSLKTLASPPGPSTDPNRVRPGQLRVAIALRSQALFCLSCGIITDDTSFSFYKKTHAQMAPLFGG